MLGYDGPVTPAHVACLPLTRGQVMQLELTTEQKSLLTPQQSSAVSYMDISLYDLPSTCRYLYMIYQNHS